ncbi:MAG: ribosome small subunit-dependent GTPase A [Myxococcota bacterium]
MSTLESLGWSDFVQTWTDGSPLEPARVVSQQRGLLHVRTASGPSPALLRGNLLDDPPVVGDWVVVRPVGDQVLIERRLPRRTVIQRRRVGGGVPQVVAANVDCVGVVTSMDVDFNPRRLERYLAVVRGAGCEARIVLSKADRVDDPGPFVTALSDPSVVVSAHTGLGMDALRDWIGTRTVALLGSSGVGKSSLINALLGAEVRDTGAVSDTDGRGQHTTTSRDLLLLPGGGCIIDTPGMREVGLSGEADPDEAFADIAALATSCTYRDCEHLSEPGCAVREAVDRGELDEARIHAYHKLVRELAFERRREDKRAMSEQKRQWAKKIKAVQRMKRDRGW